MSRTYETITPELSAWIAEQHLFFVATAPLAADGLVNCSPKGMDTFRVLGPHEVAYLDLTGSGIETVAHLRENGRIVLMFCAFTGPPRVVRLHGTGEVAPMGAPAFEELRGHFPDYPGARAVIRARIHRISESCGFGVARYEYQGDRDTLVRVCESKGEEEVARFQRKWNTRSVEGMPALDLEGREEGSGLE
jgi:hypothetical protein